MSKLTDWLAQNGPRGRRPDGIRCAVCEIPDAARDLDEYVELHRQGRTRGISLAQFVLTYLAPEYRPSLSGTTIRRHLLVCRGIRFSEIKQHVEPQIDDASGRLAEDEGEPGI